MSRTAEIDIWRTDVPLANRRPIRADIAELLPDHHLDVKFTYQDQSEPEEVQFTPATYRHYIEEGKALVPIRLAIELPGELVPSIPAYFWVEGEGLKICIGRTVLAIDLKGD